MTDTESLRCPRCNAPHKDNPDASKNSGHGWIFEWTAGECPVCQFRRERFESKSKPFLRARKLRLARNRSESGNASLTEFGSGEA